MGTRVRSPSTTKARGPGETTRRHGPRHVRARASDEARGSVPGDRLGAGRGLAQGEGRLSPHPPRKERPASLGNRPRRTPSSPRGRSAPGSVTGQSGWKSGSRACAGAPTSETAKKAAAIRLPCVRRRVPPVTWEPLTSPAAPRVRRREFRCCPISPPARAAPARGARPSRRTPPRRRRARPRICGGRPKRSTSRIGPVHASCPVELRRGSGGGDGRDRRASVADVVSPGSFRRGFTGCSGVSVQGRRVT